MRGMLEFQVFKGVCLISGCKQKMPTMKARKLRVPPPLWCNPGSLLQGDVTMMKLKCINENN